METKNIIIGIDSAYRSEERQQELYYEFIEKYLGVDFLTQDCEKSGMKSKS